MAHRQREALIVILQKSILEVWSCLQIKSICLALSYDLPIFRVNYYGTGQCLA